MFKKILPITFVMTLIAIFMYADVAKTQQVVTDGLISYWTFDEADIDGKTAMDVFGKNDGIINGESQIVLGKVGEALDFDGVDDYVDCGDDASLKLKDAFSFEFFIYPRENTQNRHIISRGIWNQGGYWVQHSDPGHVGGIYLYLHDVYLDFIIPTGSSQLEVWQHFVITYDGTTVKSYKDGEFLNEAVAEGTIENIEGNFYISKYTGADMHYIDGIIDEVRVYKRAISQDEVESNMNAEGMAIESADKLAVTWGEMKVFR